MIYENNKLKNGCLIIKRPGYLPYGYYVPDALPYSIIDKAVLDKLTDFLNLDINNCTYLFPNIKNPKINKVVGITIQSNMLKKSAFNFATEVFDGYFSGPVICFNPPKDEKENFTLLTAEQASLISEELFARDLWGVKNKKTAQTLSYCKLNIIRCEIVLDKMVKQTSSFKQTNILTLNFIKQITELLELEKELILQFDKEILTYNLSELKNSSIKEFNMFEKVKSNKASILCQGVLRIQESLLHLKDDIQNDIDANGVV